MSENVNQENKQEQENTDTPETQPQQEPSPETAEETFTVTRDQMEKMEQLPQTHRQGKGEPVRRRQGRHREALPGGAG